MAYSNRNRLGLAGWIGTVFFISMAFWGGSSLCFSEEKKPQDTANVPTKAEVTVSTNVEAPAPAKPECATRMFPIKNLPLGEAKEKIKELLSKDEKIGAEVEGLSFLREGKENRFLVVKDTAVKLQEIGQVIEALEKEITPATVDLDFDDVALSQILSTVAQMAHLNIIGGEALSGKVSIHLKGVLFDDLFNIILKTTPYTYIKDGVILRIVSRADMPLVTEVFELKFVPAAQIKDAIAHLVSEKGQVKTFSKTAQDKYANCLIITSTPESLDSIRDVVKQLDKKLKQVMIEVKFCEVSLNKDDELGIDWVLRASLTGASGPTAFPLGSTGAHLMDRPRGFQVPTGTMTLGSMSFSDFSMTIHALDTRTKINLIATPSVAARDGEDAEIVIGDTVPIPLYERMAQTGLMEVSGYQNEDIGILLRVTPIINSDNTITLKIHPEVSEITGYTGPNNERPIISSRKVTTMFTVNNGKTIVLGGLMKQKLTNTYHRVPFLGRIPLLGRLFEYNNDSEDRTELLIFITPNILNEDGPHKENSSQIKNRGEGNESEKQPRR